MVIIDPKFLDPITLNALDLITVAIVIFIASLIVNSLGFGYGMVGAPLMLLALEAQETVVILGPTAIMAGFLTFWRNKQFINWQEIIPIVILATLGAITGLYILATSDEQLIKIAIVVIIVPLTLISFLKPTSLKDKIPFPNIVGPIAGYFAGLMLGAMAIGGPLLVLFMMIQGWTSHKIRASMSLCLTCIVSAASIGFWPAGLYTEKNVSLIGISIIPLTIGSMVGAKIAKKLNETLFRKATVSLIFASCIVIIVRELDLVKIFKYLI